MIIKNKAYPRAGLVGNPSDGYFGKTISFTFKNFFAEVTLFQSPELEIQPSERDHSVFNNISHLVEDVRLYGYYGGIRLLKAAVKRFFDYCQQQGIQLDERNFTLRYFSNIPHQVGLAGSSAIITACFRALMAFYHVSIPLPKLANLTLAVENDELNISAGLQDRVIQAYEGLIYMDFNRELMEKQGHGFYEKLDPFLLPPLYIAYWRDLAEGSGIVHHSLRERYKQKDSAVLDAIQAWAGLAEKVCGCLKAGEKDKVGPLLNENFDIRRKVYNVGERNIRMVEAARSAGASAKFSGSGGAIVGTYRDEAMFQNLVQTLNPLGIEVIKPQII